MRIDIVLAGVGGQGVLSVAAVLAEAARREGFCVQQTELHGMSQRGGAVQAFLRIADAPVHSDFVSHGTADLVLALEPLEALRQVAYLKPGGLLLTAADPVENIPDHPGREQVLAWIATLPRTAVVEAAELAREAGAPRALNTVMVGAASGVLPLRVEILRACLCEAFAAKGERVVQQNLAAFEAGRRAAACAPA
ncbi:MAG: indolepyruvate oxidoreductase subunit beta [Planctomycetes bacterium]|nr:indolepyruvate oxidoreductase subunit beta [Planctomycetota bacterium]